MTTSGIPFLQLVAGGNEGVQGGSWSWSGTMLSYKLGEKSNGFVYHSCTDKDGNPGLYMSLER